MHRLQRALDAVIERVDTPSPIVLVDVMQRNIDRMQGFAAEQDLVVRPHVKTHKCVEIGRRQVQSGASGITAGNVGEAEVFAAAGFDDIFLAYPVWPAGTKGRRIRRLAEDTQLRVGVDNVAAIEALADAMGEEPDRLQVVVEIDCGARRSGARPSWLVTSRSPRSSPRCAASQTPGWPPVSAGSTPTIEFSTGSPITEIRPGEYVFCDLDNTRLGACAEDQIALFVAATVVSNWTLDQVILDVGTKALCREGNPQKGYGGIAGRKAVLAKLNEYHGFLAVPAGEDRPSVGTVVPVVPNQICPVVVSFEELIATDSEGTSLQRWPVDARGFLS